MKYVLTALALAALCVPAFAGGNPDIEMYISFDPAGASGGDAHYWTSTPYGFFTAYLCVTWVGTGFTSVSFSLTDVNSLFPAGTFSFPPVFAPTPGMFNTVVGDAFIGITLASGTCITDDPAVVGSMGFLPTTVVDFCLEVKDYPAFPRWVTDCTEPIALVDYYCVLQNGTVGAPDPICPYGDCPNPVEDATWG
ncbi:MAG: hypothetical protein KAW67_02085, partial [Candidatus Eisenbacteria sp.]|nr:hypothetical protein [Candidatus Eisenbacteria bacterium]